MLKMTIGKEKCGINPFKRPIFRSTLKQTKFPIKRGKTFEK